MPHAFPVKTRACADTKYPDAPPSEWQAFLDETAFSKPVLAAYWTDWFAMRVLPYAWVASGIYSDMPTGSQGLLVY